MAKHAADQLLARFSGAVRVQYFDLCDPACPALPDGAQLPLLLLNGEVFSMLTNYPADWPMALLASAKLSQCDGIGIAHRL